jgi:hypothetical protein
MPLTFHPKPGTIVICDYSTGFRPPEMVKVAAGGGDLPKAAQQSACDDRSDQQHGAVASRALALRTSNGSLSPGARPRVGQSRHDCDRGTYQA